MGGRSEISQFLLLLNKSIDDWCVFTVTAGEGMDFFQFFQNLVNLAVIKHHGRVGHVDLECRDAGFHHVIYFISDSWIPLGNRHMVTVVAGIGAVFIGHVMPVLKALFQSLAMILGAEINNERRSACNCSRCPCLKIVGRDRARDMEIKMCVRVNKTGEDIFACAVDFLGIRVIYICIHTYNFLVLYKEIRNPGS